MKIFRIVLVAVIVAAALAAQRPAPRKKASTKPKAAPAKTAPAPDRWPLAAIHITGNKVFSTEAIVRATGLQLGAAVNKGDLQRAVQRLTDAGAFETISFEYKPEGEKLSVMFQVQEVLDIYPVGFERLDAPDADLMKMLGQRVPLFGPQVPATGAMVKRIVETLEAYLTEKGTAAQVTGRLQPTRDGRLIMTFRPSAPPPAVTFVKFENSTLIRAEDLQRAFYQTAVGAPYIEARIRELLDTTIRPLFEEKGRLRVRFGPLRTEESKEATGVEVIVPVEEGEEFQFGAVQFAGNVHLTVSDLARLVRLEEGGLANFALVNKAVADIERRYQRDGYMHAKATVERTLDDKKKTVDLTIRVQEGDEYKLRTLVIKGLDINAEAALRKRWAIQRGQPFDAAYPEVFLKRIEEEGMFEQLGKTASRIQVDEEAKMVDVALEFAAAPPKPRPKRPDGGP